MSKPPGALILRDGSQMAPLFAVGIAEAWDMRQFLLVQLFLLVPGRCRSAVKRSHTASSYSKKPHVARSSMVE